MERKFSRVTLRFDHAEFARIVEEEMRQWTSGGWTLEHVTQEASIGGNYTTYSMFWRR